VAVASRDFRELRLEHISRDFGQFHALRDVSLTVKRGEFVALLGPSGCGKSTALNCIAGLLQVTGGAIYLDDQRLDELGPEDRGFGMVFQNYALFPHMSVRRNVGFGLVTQRRPKPEITRRVDEALALVRLETQADKLPGQLSGGQQQRVAIARAIVVAPPLVLMDEPLSNLDAKLRLEMRAEIRRIHRELGRTTIYVTHDQEEALSLADRIVVMKDGRVQQIGPPSEVFSQPANLHVAHFMGYRNGVELDCRAREGNGLQLAGHGLALRATEKVAAPGPRVMLVTRPDDIRVLGAGQAAARAGDNVLPGTVVGVEYGGNESLLDVELAPGVVFHVRSGAPVRSGDVVQLAIAPERALTYPVQ
jgi:putative spermidine/putrescine transport system ATP-binding protein